MSSGEINGCGYNDAEFNGVPMGRAMASVTQDSQSVTATITRAIAASLTANQPGNTFTATGKSGTQAHRGYSGLVSHASGNLLTRHTNTASLTAH